MNGPHVRILFWLKRFMMKLRHSSTGTEDANWQKAAEIS